MAKYPMTDVIARREYRFATEGRDIPVVVQIGKPAVFPDLPHHEDWYCPWTVQGPDGLRQLYAGGVDALQALLLAISGIHIDLDVMARRGKLTWLDQDDLGIALIGPSA